MRIIQIYPDFQIFDLPDLFSSGYGHRHISGSLNFITNIFWVFFGQAILIYVEIIFNFKVKVEVISKNVASQ